MPNPAKWCPGRDLNPHSACAKKDFKSFASADFATRAVLLSALMISDIQSRSLFTAAI